MTYEKYRMLCINFMNHTLSHLASFSEFTVEKIWACRWQRVKLDEWNFVSEMIVDPFIAKCYMITNT